MPTDAQNDNYSLYTITSTMPALRSSGMSRRGAFAKRHPLVYSYGQDWLITLALGGVFLALNEVSGHKREFSIHDTTLWYSYTEHERVPDWALYMICSAAPLFFCWLINFMTIRSKWDAHNSALGLVLSLSMTGAVTQLSKVTVGRPRPDFLSRCQFPPGTTQPPYGLSNASICTQTDRFILEDGFRSFPSGHSSMSFAGLGFLAYYLSGKVHLFDRRGHAPKAWLALTPLSCAALVAISRTMDNRHHWRDVAAGSALGVLVAYFCYRQYFPSLASRLSHLPYAPRTSVDAQEVLPTHRNGRPHAPDEPDTHAPLMDRYSDEDGGVVDVEDERIAGTVARQEGRSLHEVWQEGVAAVERHERV